MVILNPIAGRGYAARVQDDIQQLLAAEGLDFEFALTEKPWHAAELAERAANDGFETIVAAGGDGTVHEVVNGLMKASTDSVAGILGTIPIGSGSDFAYGVGVPTDLPGACHRVVHGQARVVDLCRVTVDEQRTLYFDNTVNVGFGGIVTYEARKIKWGRGLIVYLPAVLKAIFLARPPQMTIRYDDKEISRPILMITVGNGAREGGSFLCTPDAKLDDGLFDLCIAQDLNTLAKLGLIPRFMNGSHTDHWAVTMARARHVTISSPDNLIAHVDGEILCSEAHQLEFEILPRRLRVVC